MRIVFLGSDPIALPLLDSLCDKPPLPLEIAAVFTQPDRPHGRGQHASPNAIKTWAAARGIPVLQPGILDEAARQRLAEAAPDLGVVMAYGHILRDDFIATPRLGTVNLHASLLPKYRGASPIQTAIASGETRTGVTLMRVVRKLDAGPVADAESVGISPDDTALEIEAKLAAACVPLMARALPRLAAGALSFLPQDEAVASRCRRLGKGDAVLDFRLSARQAAARINAFHPWPSVIVPHEGMPLKFTRADWREGGAGAAPGTVLDHDGRGLRIATGAGVLRVLGLQRPGGRNLPADEFLRGHPITAGTLLPSVEQPPLLV